MATSSSGGSSLGQWQRLFTLLRQYLSAKNIQMKSTLSEVGDLGNSIGGVPSHPLVKSSTAVELHTAAALRALNLYLLRCRVQGQAALKRDQDKQDGTKANSHSTHRSSGRTSSNASTPLKERLQTLRYPHKEISKEVREFLGDGFAGGKDASCNGASISRFASTSSLHPYEDIGREDSTTVKLHYTSSAPMSRVSSPMGRPSTTSIAQNNGPVTASQVVQSDLLRSFGSSMSNHESQQKSPLTVPTPTYTTMRIPVVQTTNTSNRSSSIRSTSSNADSFRRSSTTFNKSNTGSNNTNSSEVTVQPVAQESEIQKALRTVNSYIPYSLSSLSQVNLNFFRGNGNGSGSVKEKEPARPQWLDKKRDVISKASVDSRTRYLVRGVSGDSDLVILRRLIDLCHHLRAFPYTKGAAIKCGAVGRILRVLSCTEDTLVAQEGRTALTLLGYAGPVKGRGLRLLTIDGGGVRGLVAIELLKRLEQQTGRPVHEMFDFICGVSTGAIVAVLVGVHRLPLDECEELYRDLSEKVFKQTTLRGATSLMMNRSYYDSKAWDTILQENMGEMPLLASGTDEEAPKLCLVASHAVRMTTQAYLFRNYVLPYRVASHYTGTSDAKMWEAVRASAAAPGYFSEFQLDGKALMDGGILVNNPTAIAVHEARQLWPDEAFQCVVSIGTGRCQPMEALLGAEEAKNNASINWTDKLRSVINSATDTEGVHTILHDLLPGNVYFRFNPHLTDEFSMDEIRPERVAAMMEDTQLYARKNAIKFEEVAAALNREKTAYHKAKDFVKRGRLLHGFDVEG